MATYANGTDRSLNSRERSSSTLLPDLSDRRKVLGTILWTIHRVGNANRAALADGL